MTTAPPRAAVSTALWRSGRVLLAVGVVAALSPLADRFPHQQAIRLELTPAQRQGASRIDVTWTKRGETEPGGGFSTRLPAAAPPSLRHELSTPNGDYALDIDVEMGRGGSTVSHTELRRNVTLTGGEVRVLLENTQQ
jgi:hypothetical protein